jgi:AcrR family transcriptional regulator
VAARRLGVESSETRAHLIDAAAQLIREEGCAAVTARRLAEKFGLKRQIVHYYFGTIDDLLVAVIRRDGARIRESMSEAIDSDEPLRALWGVGASGTPVSFELTTLALRRTVVQAEVKRFIEEFREIAARAIARHLELRGIKPSLPPVAMSILMVSLSQTLSVENHLNVSCGHAELEALVASWLEAFAARGELFPTSEEPTQHPDAPVPATAAPHI